MSTVVNCDYVHLSSKQEMQTWLETNRYGTEMEVKGWVTSGGFAHTSNVSLAMGYVPKEIADEIQGWTIEILGEQFSATLQMRPLFDPKGQIFRK